MISVIIPTHKPKYLRQTLKSLKNQFYIGFEVIVCENPDLTDEVKLLIESEFSMLNIKHVNSSIGANNARNTGIAHSTGDMIALIDDDCKANTNWLGEIYNALSNEKVSCVGGKVTLIQENNLTKLEAQYLTKIDWGCTKGYRELYQGEYLASCNLAFTREVYNKVGGFNANLGYFGKDNFIPNDEVLFIRDCANHGIVCYNNNMQVTHLIEDRINRKYLLKRAYGQGYANVLLDKEQKINGNSYTEKIYYSPFNTSDIELYIAKNIGMLHAIKGIEPSEQFYSLLEELVQI